MLFSFSLPLSKSTNKHFKIVYLSLHNKKEKKYSNVKLCYYFSNSQPMDGKQMRDNGVEWESVKKNSQELA